MISKKLNELIEHSKLQTDKIAKKIGVEESVLNSWCEGKLEPNYSQLIEISKFFDINIISLFEKKFSLKSLEKTIIKENKDLLEDNKLLKDKLIEFALDTKENLNELKKMYELKQTVKKD